MFGSIGFPNLYNRPSPKVFLLNLMNVSLVFFFFAIHVHEKNVKVPALLLLLNIKQLGRLAIDFQLFACFTLLPLMIEDGLLYQYLGYCFFYFVIAFSIHSSLSSSCFYSPPKDYLDHFYRKYFFK